MQLRAPSPCVENVRGVEIGSHLEDLGAVWTCRTWLHPEEPGQGLLSSPSTHRRELCSLCLLSITREGSTMAPENKPHQISSVCWGEWGRQK